MKKINLIKSAAIVSYCDPNFNLETVKTDLIKSLKKYNIHINSIGINMTAGDYPEIDISGILGKNIWPT